jgi:hypothetical protein
MDDLAADDGRWAWGEDIVLDQPGNDDKVHHARPAWRWALTAGHSGEMTLK